VAGSRWWGVERVVLDPEWQGPMVPLANKHQGQDRDQGKQAEPGLQGGLSQHISEHVQTHGQQASMRRLSPSLTVRTPPRRATLSQCLHGELFDEQERERACLLDLVKHIPKDVGAAL